MPFRDINLIASMELDVAQHSTGPAKDPRGHYLCSQQGRWASAMIGEQGGKRHVRRRSVHHHGGNTPLG